MVPQAMFSFCEMIGCVCDSLEQALIGGTAGLVVVFIFSGTVAYVSHVHRATPPRAHTRKTARAHLDSLTRNSRAHRELRAHDPHPTTIRAVQQHPGLREISVLVKSVQLRVRYNPCCCDALALA